MQISWNWLADYVDLKDQNPEAIAELLTDLGLEVESIEEQLLTKGDICVGEIVEAQPHPNADSLRLCKVDVGRDQALTIVCGAPNARAGIKVMVATIGSVLPGDFKIKAAKIRGEASQGMMCSERELGISEQHDSIIELSQELSIGTSIEEVFPVKDWIFTLGITPNRADCLGYLGIAREIAAKLDRPLRVPNAEATRGGGVQSPHQLEIAIEDPELCARFCSLVISGVKVAPAPQQVQKRLEASGIRPINNIVDATNFAMLEWGQPIHAYDLRDVRGQKLSVRLATEGAAVTTLDDKEHKLLPSDIVIADQERIVSLAGIMGAANSEIRDDTSEIALEICCFDPIRIRKTARRLGIHTDASHRFERGVDVGALDQVLTRVAALIAAWQPPGHESQQILAATDLYPRPLQGNRMALRLDRLRQISGLNLISQEDVIKKLGAIGIKLVDQANERMVFETPSWRHDLLREIDLIEEFIRLNGINEVPYFLPVMDIGPTPESPLVQSIEAVRHCLAHSSLSEVISFPFVGDADFDALMLPPGHLWRQSLRLANPINAEEGTMQPSVLPSLIKQVRGNQRRGRQGCRLFELARAYYHPSATESESPLAGLYARQGIHATQKAKSEVRPVEANLVAGILDQPWRQKSWQGALQATSFFDGKEIVNKLLHHLSLSNLNWRSTKEHPDFAQDLCFLHPGQSAILYAGSELIGWLGHLHPQVALNFELQDIPSPVVFELNLDLICQTQLQLQRYSCDEQNFPPTNRDLSVVVASVLSYAQMEEALQSFRRRNLSQHQLIDIYQGEKIEAGHKCMTLALRFQSPKRTLKDKEVDIEIDLLLQHLEQNCGAKLR